MSGRPPVLEPWRPRGWTCWSSRHGRWYTKSPPETITPPLCAPRPAELNEHDRWYTKYRLQHGKRRDLLDQWGREREELTQRSSRMLADSARLLKCGEAPHKSLNPKCAQLAAVLQCASPVISATGLSGTTPSFHGNDFRDR